MRPVPAYKRKRQGGQALAVEMALSFLPFFALITGIADFSMVTFMSGLFQDAVREGTRFAITYNLTYNGTTYSSQTQAVQAVVINNSLGFITSSNVSNYVSVNYYTPDNLSTPATNSQLPKTVNGVVINYLNQSGNVVAVSIQSYPWNWMVPLPNFMPGTGLNLGAMSLDVLQPLPIGESTPPSP